MSAEAVPLPARQGPRLPAAPAHLRSAEAKRLWRETVREFRIEPHHLPLLEAACKCVDRLAEARGIIDRDGIVVDDRYGVPKQHPACAVERDSRIALARLLRELQLGDADVMPDARPPRLRG